MRTRRNIVVTAVSAVVLVVMSLLGAGQATADVVNDYYCMENQDGRDECFRVGTANAFAVPGEVWHTWELGPGGEWVDEQRLPGVTATSGVDGGKNLDGRLEIFVRGGNGNLYHNWQVKPNGGWNGWQSLGGSLRYGPGFFGPFVYVYDNRIHVTAEFADGQNRTIYQTRPNCCWSGWVLS